MMWFSDDSAPPKEVVLKPNREERRRLRREMRRHYRQNTRFWRNTWRGVIPQWQAIALAQSAKATYEDYPGASKAVRRLKGKRKAAQARRATEELHEEARSLTALITRVRSGYR